MIPDTLLSTHDKPGRTTGPVECSDDSDRDGHTGYYIVKYQNILVDQMDEDISYYFKLFTIVEAEQRTPGLGCLEKVEERGETKSYNRTLKSCDKNECPEMLVYGPVRFVVVVSRA